MVLATDSEALGRMVYGSEYMEGMSLLDSASVGVSRHHKMLGTGCVVQKKKYIYKEGCLIRPA